MQHWDPDQLREFKPFVLLMVGNRRQGKSYLCNHLCRRLTKRNEFDLVISFMGSQHCNPELHVFLEQAMAPSNFTSGTRSGPARSTTVGVNGNGPRAARAYSGRRHHPGPCGALAHLCVRQTLPRFCYDAKCVVQHVSQVMQTVLGFRVSLQYGVPDRPGTAPMRVFHVADCRQRAHRRGPEPEREAAERLLVPGARAQRGCVYDGFRNHESSRVQSA